jgi:cell wall-associated NlpC family hydrolase
MKPAQLVIFLLLFGTTVKAQLIELPAEDTVADSIAQAITARIMYPIDSLINGNTLAKDSLAQQILSFSAKYLGTPYRYAASGPKAFDCSGFTSFVFRNFDIKLTHGCRTQVNEGQRVGLAELQPGDLIFFTSSRSNGKAGHVGIVVENYGNGNVRFIHASSARSGGVKYDELSTGHYARRYITGLRVLSPAS